MHFPIFFFWYLLPEACWCCAFCILINRKWDFIRFFCFLLLANKQTKREKKLHLQFRFWIHLLNCFFFGFTTSFIFCVFAEGMMWARDVLVGQKHVQINNDAAYIVRICINRMNEFSKEGRKEATNDICFKSQIFEFVKKNINKRKGKEKVELILSRNKTNAKYTNLVFISWE